MNAVLFGQVMLVPNNELILLVGVNVDNIHLSIYEQISLEGVH